MTASKSSRAARTATARRGFTLIEMLVVLSIIVVLAGILLPTLSRARHNASRMRVAIELQAISAALEAYKQDHGDYPRVGAPVAAKGGYDGAIALCQALIAPGNPDDLDTDNVATPGFRTQAGSKVYGPYLAPGQFKPAHPTDPNNTDPTLFAIMDRFGKPVLYFPASPARLNVKIASTPAPYVDRSEFSRYDANDNYASTSPPFGPFERASGDPDALRRIRLMIGDKNADGVLQADETEVGQSFLLWSAGPDEVFGPDADAAGDRAVIDAPDVAKCDDVMNFR